MKTQALTLAVSAVAVLSTTAANAQTVERFGYGVGTVGTSNMLSYPAVLDNSAVLGGNVLSYPGVIEGSDIGACGVGACGVATSCGGCASPLSCAPLFGRHTYYDKRFGAGYYGGGGLLGLGGVRSFSAVIPNACGASSATPICGQRLQNSLFDIRIFRFGLGFGRVSPRFDNRPPGWAI